MNADRWRVLNKDNAAFTTCNNASRKLRRGTLHVVAGTTYVPLSLRHCGCSVCSAAGGDKEEQLEWLAAKRRLFILFAAYLRCDGPDYSSIRAP